MNTFSSQWKSVFLIILLSPIAALSFAVGVEKIFSGHSSDELDLVRGQNVFKQRCSSCHALEAGAISGFGPNLAGMSGVNSMSAAAYVLQSVVEPDVWRQPGVNGHMPKGLLSGVDEQTVRGLIGYVLAAADLQETLPIKNLEIDVSKLELAVTPVAKLATLQRGQELFFGEAACSSCHSIYGEPGSDLYAPSLANAGGLSEAYLYTSMREPNETVADSYQDVTLEFVDGTSLGGNIVARDAGYVTLRYGGKDGYPLLIQVPRKSILRIDDVELSRMPPYGGSEEDSRALVAFLRFL